MGGERKGASQSASPFTPATTTTTTSAKRRSKYPAKQHLAKIVAHLPHPRKWDHLFLAGAKEVPIGTSDQNYGFIQESFFHYCSGVPHPDCFVLYHIPTHHLTLFIPPRREGRDIVYLGQRESVVEAGERYDVDTVRTSVEVPAVLASLTSGLYTMSDETLRRAMTWARSVKTGREVRTMIRANDISSRAHQAVMAALGEGRVGGEVDLECIFRTACARPDSGDDNDDGGSDDGRQQAYAPIFASGKHASVLHYADNDGPLRGDMILVDAGCAVNHYASDVTRTYPLSKDGRFTPLARRLYAHVLSVQLACIRHVRPGVLISQIAKVAQDLVCEALVAWKFVRCDVRTAKEYELGRAFLMHGIGHHIGLDVHDVTPTVLSSGAGGGGVCAPTNDRVPRMTESESGTVEEVPLEAGMVITVEPGFYFNAEYLRSFFDSDRVGHFFDRGEIDRWMHLGGVRIEDSVLVTAQSGRHDHHDDNHKHEDDDDDDRGHRVLTTVPKSIEAIEALCRPRK